MTERCVLLVGTPKGAFVLDGDTDRATGTFAGRCARAGRSTTSPWSPAPARSSPAAAVPGTGRPSGAARTSARPGPIPSEGLTYGDDGPKVATVWNVTATDDTIYAGVEPAGLFRSRDRGGTWEHVEGLTNHPTRAEWQPGGGGLILHSIVPHRDDPDRVWVGISSVGVFETRDGGATWATRNRGVRAGFQPDTVPGVRPVRAQAGDGGRRRRAPLPAEPLRRVPVRGRRRAVGGDHGRPAVRVRLPDDRRIRATRRRSGRSRSTARTRAVSCPTRRPPCGARMTAATAGSGPASGCRSEDAYLRRPARGDGQRRAWTRSASTSGPAPGRSYGSADEGRSLVAARGPPAADLVGRGRRRWLSRRPPTGACRSRPAAPAIVHLPRSLVVAVPGRRAAGRGARRDRRRGDRRRRPAGPGDRQPRPGRGPEHPHAHLNVFVAGERAGLQTPVPAGADVHIIPAVSGG